MKEKTAIMRLIESLREAGTIESKLIADGIEKTYLPIERQQLIDARESVMKGPVKWYGIHNTSQEYVKEKYGL